MIRVIFLISIVFSFPFSNANAVSYGEENAEAFEQDKHRVVCSYFVTQAIEKGAWQLAQGCINTITLLNRTGDFDLANSIYCSTLGALKNVPYSTPELGQSIFLFESIFRNFKYVSDCQ